LTVATIIIDMQVDFFLPHPRLTQNRAKLTANINDLAGIARRNSCPVIWVKQVFASDLHDAPLDVKRGGHRIVIEGTEGANLLPKLHFGRPTPSWLRNAAAPFLGHSWIRFSRTSIASKLSWLALTPMHAFAPLSSMPIREIATSCLPKIALIRMMSSITASRCAIWMASSASP